MPEIQFLSFDDALGGGSAATAAAPQASSPAGAAGAPAPADDGVAAEQAVACSHRGRRLALAGDWDAAETALRRSAALRTELAARGAAGPTVVARGWSDVAVLCARRDDRDGAGDAVARARAVACADYCAAAAADVDAALGEVEAWLRRASEPAPAAPAAVDAYRAVDFTTELGVDPPGPPTDGWGRGDAIEPNLRPLGGAARPAPVPVPLLPPPPPRPAPSPPAPPAPASGPARGLPWLELEGPTRVWEQATDDGATCAVAAEPEAGDAAPARNAKIDEVVALATATAPSTGGQLLGLLRKIGRR